MSERGFARLGADIDAILADAKGVIGVCVRDLATGEEVGTLPDEPFPMASVSKVPILVAAYRRAEEGALDLAERVTLTDACRGFGSGLLNFFDSGLNPTVRDLLHLMIIVSDNAATDLVLERVGGPAAVTAVMRDLGITDIRVDRTIAQLLGDYFIALDPGLEGMRYGEWDARCDGIEGLRERSEDLEVVREAVNRATEGRDLSSPHAMARLCALIAQDGCASAESCAAMRDILGRQQLNGRLPRHLPAFWRFPHKTGTLGSGAVVNDAGILYHHGEPVAAVAAFCRDMRDPVSDTETRLARVGRAVWDHYAGAAAAGTAGKGPEQ
jgi:Beta-lactamase class A